LIEHDRENAMNRRNILKSASLLALSSPRIPAFADSPRHLSQGYSFGSPFRPKEPPNQGPFDIDRDGGWQTVLFATPPGDTQ
jgi:hypothetical protein